MGTRLSNLQRNRGISSSSKCVSSKTAQFLSHSLQQMLIANEADVDHQDVFGFTPLHMAAIKGFTTIVEVSFS